VKAKYYPHVTIFGAAALLAGPLCLVLLLPYLSSDVEFEDDFSIVDVKLDSPRPKVHVDEIIPECAVAKADFGLSELAKRNQATSHNTRIAMRPSENESARFAVDIGEPRFIAAEISDADAVLDMAGLEETHADTRSPILSEFVPMPSGISAMAGLAKPVEDFIEPIIRAPSYFDSTGHLALTHGGNGAMAGTAIPPIVIVPKSKASTENDHETEATVVADASAGKPEDVSTRAGNRTPRSRIAKAKADAQGRKVQDELTVSTTSTNSSRMLLSGTFGETPPEILVDVILQQPLESRAVLRMENLVAVTQAKGWPVALVRSDLPDDEWWVQQMVGIRGNAFAARVNFGNEYSISGSVYHLVFVFLDSPDEVRRFRIAKQFKKLPEGIRHTREFTFVRQ